MLHVCLGQVLLFSCLLVIVSIAKCHLHHGKYIPSAAAVELIAAVAELKKRETFNVAEYNNVSHCIWILSDQL